MYNILVTGANGQLGLEIQNIVNRMDAENLKNVNYFFTSKNTLDITDKDSIAKFVNNNKINIIINTAAYTLVDNAETNLINANKVNNLAVGYLAEIAQENGIKLIHVSTDYVYDGNSNKPYAESDLTNPKNNYGRTKLDGENALRVINPKNSIIIRTSWVYSSFGKNFVNTILHLAGKNNELRIIYDQIGSPTYARDLAQVVLSIMFKIACENVEIYHYSNDGISSWYDFAYEIIKFTKLDCSLIPINSREYKQTAKRPLYTVISKDKIKQTFGVDIPHWKDSLEDCLKQYKRI
ncbi:MAG TPA: dTDP-4-dehydrorhamnose reductase [Arcobacter sp.]|nr:dTDP-4-dehydrorhamnose reductase [Arcobacter sp.]